jgi:hypothetical protein
MVLLWPLVGCMSPASGIKRSVVAQPPFPILRLLAHAGGKAQQELQAGLSRALSQIGAVAVAPSCAELWRNR